jgi:hypothetical protein
MWLNIDYCGLSSRIIQSILNTFSITYLLGSQTLGLSFLKHPMLVFNQEVHWIECGIF